MNIRKTMQTFMRLGLCLIFITGITACSSLRTEHQTVSVSGIPKGATLWVNGNHCDPPYQVEVMRNKDVTIKVFKEGYSPYNETIEREFNMTGMLDAVGTVLFVFPVVGLYSPGAFTLEKTEVALVSYN